MTKDIIVAFGVVRHRRSEGQPGKLRQVGALRWRTETELAQLAKPLPGRHAFILFEGVVPGLCRPTEMVRRQPRAIRGESTLAAEKLLTLVEPVERIDAPIVGGELQFVEPRRSVGVGVAAAPSGRRGRSAAVEQGPVGAPVERPGRRGRRHDGGGHG